MGDQLQFDFTKVIERRGTGSRKWDARGAVFGNPDALPLWIADMDFASPPAVARRLVERASHPIYGYNTQEESLYQVFIDWVKLRHNWEIEKEWILLTPGVVPAIVLTLLALSEPGDGVIIQTPVYPPFFDSIRDNERRIVENPLLLKNGRYEIDFADLEQKLADPANKLLLLCSPHNPVGRVWTREELTQVYELCRKYNVDVLADEIHSDLILPGHRHTVFAALGDPIAKESITFMAASKTFNIAGLNLSFVVVPCKRRRAKIEAWMTRLHIRRNNLFGVLATEAAYREGAEWLAELLQYLDGNAEALTEFVRTRLPGVRVTKPEGTYLGWLDFREHFSSNSELRKFLVQEAGVGFNPGEDFGKSGVGFARINFATQRIVLIEALTRIETALAR
ncbi:MAG: patB [Firmicutes bacterium]|nr:patB [Bacillota bacterium]